jgi:hypothetical protein
MSISQPILEEFLTREELAAELRRSPRTLDRWKVLGVGPPRTPVGREIFYRRASVQAWLLACEHQGQSGKAASEKSRLRERRAVA